MNPVTSFLRFVRIQRVFIKYRLDTQVAERSRLSWLRFLVYCLPWNWVTRSKESAAANLRLALEELGPVFVKFGQILSTRRDLLSPDFADELARLQDCVPPFPSAEAVAIIERAYGRSVAEVFESFDSEPLASASIAQVHRATLPGGVRAVVKVVRPGIRDTIRRDIGLMYVVAGLASRLSSELARLRPVDVVREYEQTIIDELDMMREAANASLLRRNFAGSSLLYVPEVYWDWCRPNVLVMEEVSGIPIDEVETLRAQGVNMRRLGEAGVKIFFSQVFKHNFFHADMHPGNIFVSPQGQYIAMDFGIMGALSPSDQRYLAENFIAFFNRDYRRVAEAHVHAGWVPMDTRLTDFEAAIRTVCEPIFDKPLEEISFGVLLIRLFQTARRFNMEVQPQLVLLQKTVLNIEGLGRQLYPQLDLWKTAKPFLEDWMNEQRGPKAILRKTRTNFPQIVEQLPDLPMRVLDALEAVADGGANRPVSNAHNGPGESTHREPNNYHQTGQAIITGALLISASVIFADFRSQGLVLPWAFWAICAATAVSLGLLLRSRVRKLMR